MNEIPDCPQCDSATSNRKSIAHGWYFCSACGCQFLIDAAGEVVTWITGSGKRRARG